MSAVELGMPMPGPLAGARPGPRPVLKLSVWLCDLTYTQQAISAETMPQAVAGLATYASTRMHFAVAPTVFKFPEALADALDEGPPDVIGFSHYVWNSHLTLGFARTIKQTFPRTTIVLGGPHYPLSPRDQITFWHQRLAGAADFYIDGEGEEAFAELLAHLNAHPRQTVRDRIRGVHSMSPDRREVFLPKPRPRLRDLSAIPSPYTAGLLDEFFARGCVPTVQTNRGCPFTCTFCQEGTKYFSPVAAKTPAQVEAELHYIGRKMAPLVTAGSGRNELLITDSNFGMYPQDKETCTVLADCQQDYGWPRVVNVTTGKNQRERVLDAVAQVPGTISLSGAVQSLDADVLTAVRRKNISPHKMVDIALASARAGAGSYSEVILALPGDTKDKHLESLRGLMDARFDRLNMFQLTLLPGSEMYSQAYRNQWGLRTKWRVIPRCFGRYTVLGSEVRAVEADEVCVALPGLPYQDYRACRLMDLLVAALYNTGTFATVLALVRAHGISPMRWLQACRDLDHGSALARVLAEFLRETDEQLFDTREDLLAHATAEVEQYIAGQRGNNLLYTYRMRMISEALDDLADLAQRAGLAVLREAGAPAGAGSLIEQVLAEGVAYHRLRLADVFTPAPPPEVSHTAVFDIDRLLTRARDGADLGALDGYRLPEPARRSFVLTQRQRDTLATYVGLMGASTAGLGWLLTKVRMPDIVREPRLAIGSGTAPGPHRSDAVTS
ncbi:cobalamin-dependent protein [Streptomyces spectabilis]|uniref:B12-binding domain-containing radical SAM protein n=1 Tax=Streptomyces spectabilis TaxID=68270 RepID=UPI00341001EA